MPLFPHTTFVALAASALALALAAPGLRAAVFLDRADLDAMRARLDKETPHTLSAYQQVKYAGRLDDSLAPRPLAHWHVPARYKDAEGHLRARLALKEDANRAYALALRFRLEGDAAHAAEAARYIRAWRDGIKTWSREDDSMLSFSYHFPAMVFAADLLRGSAVWSEADEAAFAAFLREHALAMSTERIYGNNWSTWGVVLTGAIGAYLDDQALEDRAWNRWRELLDLQMDERGHLTKEVTRNNGTGQSGVWYTNFTLMPAVLGAQIAEKQGVNLFDYQSPRGRTLRTAYLVAAAWCDDPASFPYFKGDPKLLGGTDYVSYFEILLPRWPDEAAARVLARLRPLSAEHSAPWLTFTHGL
jgi:hypothetical protein